MGKKRVAPVVKAPNGDALIYEVRNGIGVRVGTPSHPEFPNFLITWQGMDWSGFRPLADCLDQFGELSARSDGGMFAIVER